MNHTPKPSGSMAQKPSASPTDNDIATAARQLVAANVGRPDVDFVTSSVSGAPHITAFAFLYGSLVVSMQLDRHSADGTNLGPMAAKAVAELIRQGADPASPLKKVHWVKTVDKNTATISGRARCATTSPYRRNFELHWMHARQLWFGCLELAPQFFVLTRRNADYFGGRGGSYRLSSENQPVNI